MSQSNGKVEVADVAIVGGMLQHNCSILNK
jgi:hypothetical protein